jgi:DNA gyrase subunit B
MPELIERGHLYVAQPPLYRVLAGKKERYIKDEEGFNAFLLKRISQKEKVLLEGGEVISGHRLVKLLSGVITFYENVKKLSKRGYSPRFIEFLVSQGVKNKKQFKNKMFMENLFQRLEENEFGVSDIQLSEEDGYYEFLVSEMQNGGQTSAVNWEFFSSPELRLLMGLSPEIEKVNKGCHIMVGEAEKREIDDPQHLLTQLMEGSKKGLTIQRYKGLGEMNPGQLWTTTMDPEKRTLLRIRIEDALEADDIFTVLMGDKVEPRREFIQNNALEVTELDI